MLTLGCSGQQTDLYDKIGQPTVTMALRQFCQTVIKEFGPESLRQPTETDLTRTVAAFVELWLPVFIADLDCAGWNWCYCPNVWTAIFSGQEGFNPIRLEEICDPDTWILPLFADLPGMMNDSNILAQSPHFVRVHDGQYRPYVVHMKIGTYKLQWFYYLADGIYSYGKLLAKTITLPRSAKERAYSLVQEGVRKVVKRTFGTFFQQFHIFTVGA